MKLNFQENPGIIFYINNRGKKGLNIFGIHAYGDCLELEENHVVGLLSFQEEIVPSGVQKEFSSSVLKNYDVVSGQCTLQFDLLTSLGKFEQKIIVKCN